MAVEKGVEEGDREKEEEDESLGENYAPIEGKKTDESDFYNARPISNEDASKGAEEGNKEAGGGGGGEDAEEEEQEEEEEEEEEESDFASRRKKHWAQPAALLHTSEFHASVLHHSRAPARVEETGARALAHAPARGQTDEASQPALVRDICAAEKYVIAPAPTYAHASAPALPAAAALPAVAGATSAEVGTSRARNAYTQPKYRMDNTHDSNAYTNPNAHRAAASSAGADGCTGVQLVVAPEWEIPSGVHTGSGSGLGSANSSDLSSSNRNEVLRKKRLQISAKSTLAHVQQPAVSSILQDANAVQTQGLFATRPLSPRHK